MGGGSWTWRLLPRLALHAMARASNERGGQLSRAGSQLQQGCRKPPHTYTQPIARERYLHPSQAEIDELPKENAMGMSGR